MKEIWDLTKFNLKVTKKQWMIWSIILFGITFLYMILFESMHEMGKMKLDAMPKEILQLVGIDSLNVMLDYNLYFGMIYNILIIAISIFGGTYICSLIRSEEKNKTIDFLYGLPINRNQILLSKLLTTTICLYLLIIVTLIAAIICGMIVGGETYDLMKIIQIIKVSSLSPFIFMCIGTFIAGISAKLSSGSIISGVIFGSYMIGYLAVLLENKGELLQYLSPFQLFSASNALVLNNQTIISMTGYFIISIVFIVIGLKFYQSRDYQN